MVSLSKYAAFALSVSCVHSLSLTSAAHHFVDKAMTQFGFGKEHAQQHMVFSFPGSDERPVPGDSPIIQCDISEEQVLVLNSVVLKPNPPVKGENLTFIAEGFLKETIDDGAYVEVDVRYGFIRLVHQTFDLCEEIEKVDLHCPVKKGTQIIKKEVEIPYEVPPGKYIVNARAYTADDELITCLSATVEFPA